MTALEAVLTALGLTVLPATLDTQQAATVLGVAPNTLYRLAAAGEAPIEPLHLGRRLRWPTARLLAVLGVEVD